ncbi:response regulator [Oscillatoria sp. FACHB-1407]|uniref:response regulator n=1 Tax=Oscillatoria sp. FACHB-1407 TaxID=2692847 RepID=UPI0016831D8C|nr:response regulator [Oscillatoria sp. FACHB-1407]MBD2461939.1 response regulator [Oscillatoria sp. FACHB-1407]
MYHLAIVDDNESWCFVLALRLQQQGYVVSTFTDVHAFLQQAARFDLVLIDFSMPVPRYQAGMDGPEVICKVRHRLEYPPLMVLVSSFFTEDLLSHAAEICPEADAILSKRTEATTMLRQIKQLLEQREQRDRNQGDRHYTRSSQMVSSSSRGQQGSLEQRTRREHPE